MRVQQFGAMLLVTLLANDASAQFGSARPTVTSKASKASVTSAASASSGGFLGSDACTSAHTPAGSGSVAGVPFTTGTTGTQGQNEALCYAFGSTFIDNDVWYDWTCTSTRNAVLSMCAGTSVDTKVAVYPFTGDSSCPSDGSALACNDDACGLQSKFTWAVTSGVTYTIQVGTFPGAAGGSGTFDITQVAPFPCGIYDDGTTENALGLIAGGQIGWLHAYDCLRIVDRVSTAYGTPTGTSPPNGGATSIHLYEDADCDANPTTPAGGLTVKWSLAAVLVNWGTDIFNVYDAPGGSDVSITSACSFVMATADQVPGDFMAPMDQTNPVPAAWVAGSTLGPGTMDTTNLNNNNVAPLQMQAIGFPASFLLRAYKRECWIACEACVDLGGSLCTICASCNNSANDFPGVCFGDSGCPCANDGDGLGGCRHTLGTGGTFLAGAGAASLSGDTFLLVATRARNAPGIFFQADNTLLNPSAFGDGLRCCGVNVVRIGTYLPTGNTTDTATGNLIGGIGPPISAHPGNAGLSAGDTRCYQYWHRDPPAGVCGSGFNLSNAVQATWTL